MDFVTQPIPEALCGVVDDSTILLADGHNFPIVRGLGETVLVTEPHVDTVHDIRTKYRYAKVVAVGGCSVLDVGRACAEPGSLRVFPSILSNSCLSTDRSVLIRDGVRTSRRTVAPVTTVISEPSVRAAHRGPGVKWTISGLGDLFSSLSASIEYQCSRGDDRTNVSLNRVTSCVPVVWAAVEWVLGSPVPVSELDLRSLARYLHESSLDVLRLGHTRLNAASEHLLCYRLQERYHYPADRATHGSLVSIGTLLVCATFSRSSGERDFYRMIRRLYEKSGLPGTYGDLARIGVRREHVLRGLADLADTDCLLGRLYRKYGCRLVDDVFG
ncbi:iron-containing alcohol dehydrogenase [Streptomyces lomondensis]|uniref:Iron-containing alcohol dehydrogenase n=1 Tax=Streptomyces lomondensis TaxID=68229 RepID=A0ABQ2X204_9ACTN|nr:iron-containing alcohol dehydrogenase [Streptomyces lomondensis]MCF0082285.1 iron-containing alcohol dehydrogenase [Streptomyces lomondensis]GGW93590.1 hypothetical protein GCM10010383_23800 [Streptomyces lomondensis]